MKMIVASINWFLSVPLVLLTALCISSIVSWWLVLFIVFVCIWNMPFAGKVLDDAFLTRP